MRRRRHRIVWSTEAVARDATRVEPLRGCSASVFPSSSRISAAWSVAGPASGGRPRTDRRRGSSRVRRDRLCQDLWRRRPDRCALTAGGRARPWRATRRYSRWREPRGHPSLPGLQVPCPARSKTSGVTRGRGPAQARTADTIQSLYASTGPDHLLRAVSRSAAFRCRPSSGDRCRPRGQRGSRRPYGAPRHAGT